MEELSKLTSVELPEEDLKLGGVSVWTTGYFSKAVNVQKKRFPLVAVVLEAKSLDYFERFSDLTRNVSFQYNPGVLVNTNDLSWDLIITKPDG